MIVCVANLVDEKKSEVLVVPNGYRGVVGDAAWVVDESMHDPLLLQFSTRT